MNNVKLLSAAAVFSLRSALLPLLIALSGNGVCASPWPPTYQAIGSSEDERQLYVYMASSIMAETLYDRLSAMPWLKT